MDRRYIAKPAAVFAINIISIILLGIILQTGGAYIVNAAVEIMGGSSVSAAADAAAKYGEFMERVGTLEPREIVHIIFVAPLVEEIVFRLIFLRAGRMILPFWAANLVQSVLFAVYHTTAVQRMYGFAMGLIIGCVFYYCPLIYRASAKEGSSLLELPNSLFGAALTFILHMTINTAGKYLVPFFPADLPIPIQFVIGTVFMGVAVAACIRLYVQSRRAAAL